MLHKNSHIISPTTFQLVQQLQELPELNSFYLVGGTALALQLGHRNSIDIDLFTVKEFDIVKLLSSLELKFNVEVTHSFRGTLLSKINSIKTDFIYHNYPIIREPICEEGIIMLSKEDIVAMKLHAIIQSGKRLKDFIDIYFLLEHLCLGEMINFFAEKYNYMNPTIALKAVNFFGDIDENIDPPKTIKKVNLEQIKKRIQEATVKSKKVF